MDDHLLSDHLLYGSKGSGSAAVEAALKLARVPYRVVETATWERNDAYDDLLKVNPLGQVPTLVLPDGTAVSESAAILIHLGLAHPASGLIPADASERARALRGLVFVAANCYAAIGVIDYPERWTGDTPPKRPAAASPQGGTRPRGGPSGADPSDDETTKERVRAGARARLHACWSMFADVFGREPYLDGEAPGALDCLAAVVSKWSGARAHLAAHRPALHATIARIESHPVIAPVFAHHWPPKP